ncbi:MAG: chitin-binding domain-containing protein, partial [Gammaproteobacteria bacterium]|nr:chitin-binding domain-containing protein [Gammaproteobacteria bacterium]
MLVSLASCARGSPVELINGRLVTHTAAVPAVPTLTQLRLVPATAAPVVTVAARNGGVTGRGREDEGYDINPQYNFGYSIADTLTGDSKTREESRDGDVVRGSYSVADPDGRIRTVTYTADAVNGFQAKVTYDGAEGPVAIPFNAPSAAPAAVSAVATIDEEDTVIAARVPTTATATRQSINASRLIPLRSVAAAPASAIRAVHTAAVPTVFRTAAAPTVFRTAAAPAVHAVHHTAVPTVIRTASPATAVHAVH